MLKNFELGSDKKLVSCSAPQHFAVVLNPTKNEIGQLSESFHFPFDYLGGILDDYENARFETDEQGNSLLLLQFPSLSDTQEIETYPYSLVITPQDMVIFALNHEVALAPILEHTYETKRFKHQLIYRIISQMTQLFHDYLRQFRQKSHDVTKNIKKSTKNDQLLEMIQIQASLVYFQDALQNNLEVLKKFIDNLRQKGDDGFAERIFDLYIETNQARTEAKIQAKLLENLRDLFSNIVANNLNIVMKIMTSATFVLGIPAVIVGFYGMNVPIPGQTNQWMMWVIVGCILLISGLVTWLLRKKDML